MLVLVATPIGNLGDVTLRAVEALKGADLVAAEDTRRTGLLLKHLGIRKPQVSFHEHNEEEAGKRILALLREGKTVALVSNAGTPGISDPGFTLVRAAAAEGLPVTMAPGPCALVAAVVLSGLPAHAFDFRGFPPRKSSARRRFLETDRASSRTLVYYESPYRIRDFLRDAADVLGDRRAALANDLTKLHERVSRGTLSELLASLDAGKVLGEFTVVVAGNDAGA